MKKRKFPELKDLDEGVYIQFLENTSRTEEPHTHPFPQIVFLTSGKMTHRIGGIIAELTMGEMAIIPPNVTHSVAFAPNTSCYALSFYMSIFGEIHKNNEQSVLFLKLLENSAIPIFPKTTLANRDILPTESLFKQIEIELLNKEVGYLENVTSYIIVLINQFIRRYFEQQSSISEQTLYTSKQMVISCIKYVDEHMTENLSLSEMAKMSNVSVSTFCLYFKQLTGKSFTEYLKHKRVAYANELIKKGYEITAIASFCGFGDFSSFSRSYKQVMGMSPSEYKKLYIKNS